MEICTCTAPVNIAVIKYWGKRNEELVLPVNSSISVTLDQDQLRAKTTVVASKEHTDHKIWLNGRSETVNTRVQNLLKAVRCRAISQGKKAGEVLDWNVHIYSENNFPTAAGLASSAAGYACLAYTLAQLYKVTGDISDIARRGSGSACRSVYGGFVIWEMGEADDGSDSRARQLWPETHWPELHVLILVVSDHKKPVGSSDGMQATVQTSDLLQERVRLLPKQIKLISDAIQKKDFHTFAELTMKDSNQLHAVCLDTFPPISYLTDVSRQIISLIHAFNKFHGKHKVAYTYDAGPNACLYLLEEDVGKVVSLVSHFFPPSSQSSGTFLTGLPVETDTVEQEFISQMGVPVQPGALQYIIHTRPGPGPQVCDPADDTLVKGLRQYRAAEKRKSDCIS